MSGKIKIAVDAMGGEKRKDNKAQGSFKFILL